MEFGSVGFGGEGKTGVPGEKPLEAKDRTNSKLNSNAAPGLLPANAFTTVPNLLHNNRTYQKRKWYDDVFLVKRNFISKVV